MSKIISIVNCETQEIETREQNADEINDEIRRDELNAILENDLLVKKQAKLALLEKLGITEDEAKLLLS